MVCAARPLCAWRACANFSSAMSISEMNSISSFLSLNHFARWLTLWNVTVDEMYRGPVAQRAKVQAGRIAKSMHRRLRGVDAGELDALAVR
jgi:hemoglobin